MNIRSFNNYMNAIENSIDAQHNHLEDAEQCAFEKIGNWALEKLEKIFNDTDQNIRRWLNAKPCIFKSWRTGERIEVKIGNDREALFYFLIFANRVKMGIDIGDDFRNNLALLITRSCSDCWEEC